MASIAPGNRSTAAGCALVLSILSACTSGVDNGAGQTTTSIVTVTTPTVNTSSALVTLAEDRIGEEFALSPFEQIDAMAQIDNAVTALRVGDFKTAALNWRPNGVGAAQAAVALAEACDAGCGGRAEIAWARAGGGKPESPILEVFFRTDTGDIAVSAEREGGFGGWIVTSPVIQALTDVAGAMPFDDVASVLTADGGELAVARNGVVELWSDGRREWRPHPHLGLGVGGASNGWLYTEEMFISATDPTVVYDYPSTTPSGQTVVANTIGVVDGRFVTQVESGSSTDDARMVDCDSGSFVDVAPLITYGNDGEWRATLAAADSVVVLRGDAEGNARLELADGTALGDDYTSGAALNPSGRWVAFLDHTPGRDGSVDHLVTRRVMIRSTIDGSPVGEWVFDGTARGAPLWLGTSLLVSTGPDWGNEEALPQLHVIDVASGRVQTLNTPAVVLTTSG